MIVPLRVRFLFEREGKISLNLMDYPQLSNLTLKTVAEWKSIRFGPV